MALRRTIMSKDAEMAGDYRRMQVATAEAIKRDAQFSPANYPHPLAWIEAKNKALEDLINQRQMQAVEESDRAVEQGVVVADARVLQGRQIVRRVGRQARIGVDALAGEVAQRHAFAGKFGARSGQDDPNQPEQVVIPDFTAQDGKQNFVVHLLEIMGNVCL